MICILFGCVQYESVPVDVKIVAMKDTCAMIPSGWSEKVTIDSSGTGVYEQLIYPRDTPHIQTKTFRLSEAELLSLLNSIEESGFFGLEGDDSGRCIWDSCDTIQITRNGSTKAFRNEGCDIKAFNDAEKLIWDVTKNKTSST